MAVQSGAITAEISGALMPKSDNNWASPDIYGANPYGVSVVSVPVTNVTQAW